MDASLFATLIALITVFGSAMIGLLLYSLRAFDNRFNKVDGRINNNTERINCIDRKVVKLGVLIGLANSDKVITHKSPLKIRENETVTEVIERYMKEGESDGKRKL